VNSDGEEVTSDGKPFHIRAPATGKVRRPTVETHTAGTIRLSATEDWSLCREGMTAVHVNCCRYCGGNWTFLPWTYSTFPAYSVKTQASSFGCF